MGIAYQVAFNSTKSFSSLSSHKEIVNEKLKVTKKLYIYIFSKPSIHFIYMRRKELENKMIGAYCSKGAIRLILQIIFLLLQCFQFTATIEKS